MEEEVMNRWPSHYVERLSALDYERNGVVQYTYVRNGTYLVITSHGASGVDRDKPNGKVDWGMVQ